MTAPAKKHLERNAKEIFPIDSTVVLRDRSAGSESLPANEISGTVIRVTREEILVNLTGRRVGHEGRLTTFRIPQLTQKGGDLQIVHEG